MAKRTFKVWRGDARGGDFQTYQEEVSEGMVVLDVLHAMQASQTPDLAVRWNCKAKLACMTRMNSLPPDQPVTVQPLKTFPVIRDLVTDVSWNYRQNKRIKPFKPIAPGPDGKRRMYQEDADRPQEFRKCIECFLCQDVCHVLRDHAGLEMNPLDDEDRIPELKEHFGSGMCNITRCCTEVCPEHINITDNGIIPLKERVVDRYYDPLAAIGRKLLGIRVRKEAKPER
jgi:succinate dehydrogenase / fumarate reductase iron-sulfur subunit